ncbi:Serine/threonine-protein kinase 16 [Ananas comosus]|uniref:non-specific serine/threonine protein kinase n=1 Tax=Ananas comosus TaxID=4615 RepID=A0A199VYU4_ANACO|nr:Serine/threonine-protein kinase 16 [Ananas comosus]
MGRSSGLNALYWAMRWGGDAWINEDRFRILKQLGEGGYSSLFIVKEIATAAGEDNSSGSGGGITGKRRRHHHTHSHGLKHLHIFDPPYAHSDVKPSNVLITHTKGQQPLTILTDFGSARPARKQIRSRSEALELQARPFSLCLLHCSAPFRAPELCDCLSHTDIEERTDVRYLGCTLYTIM